MSVVVYMYLLNEGTDAWRPVHAEHVRDDVYEITVDQVPGGEQWQFPPRSHVRCREHTFSDGHTRLVAFELAASS